MQLFKGWRRSSALLTAFKFSCNLQRHMKLLATWGQLNKLEVSNHYV